MMGSLHTTAAWLCDARRTVRCTTHLLFAFRAIVTSRRTKPGHLGQMQLMRAESEISTSIRGRWSQQAWPMKEPGSMVPEQRQAEGNERAPRHMIRHKSPPVLHCPQKKIRQRSNRQLEPPLPLIFSRRTFRNSDLAPNFSFEP